MRNYSVEQDLPCPVAVAPRGHHLCARSCCDHACCVQLDYEFGNDDIVREHPADNCHDVGKRVCLESRG
jgi:hypothetical protein